jgi:hypothetical protein
MKRLSVLAALTALLGINGIAGADTNSGTLTVTGAVVSSIGLTIESAGASTGGTGTSAVTSVLGNISRYATNGSGFTRTSTAGVTSWKLTSSVHVKVEKANLDSDDYMLKAKLGSTPGTGITWTVGAHDLNADTDTTLAATATYGSSDNYVWDIVVTDAAAAASINNSIVFTATSN